MKMCAGGRFHTRKPPHAPSRIEVRNIT